MSKAKDILINPRTQAEYNRLMKILDRNKYKAYGGESLLDCHDWHHGRANTVVRIHSSSGICLICSSIPPENYGQTVYSVKEYQSFARWQPLVGEKFWFVYVNSKAKYVIGQAYILNEKMLNVILSSGNYYRTRWEARGKVYLTKIVMEVVKENEQKALKRWEEVLDSDECKIALTGEK